jgi:hypothetical protein
MKKSQTTDLNDPKVNVKVVLSGLWISMLFVFAYVDSFSFWRADVINGALDGTVPGTGFEIDQTFLALTTVYILIPALWSPSRCSHRPRSTEPPTSSSVCSIYGLRDRVASGRDLDLLHPRKRRRGGALTHHRPSRVGLAKASGRQSTIRVGTKPRHQAVRRHHGRADLDAAWLGHSPDLNACWLR